VEVERDVDVLCVALFTSATAATSSLLVSPWTGVEAGTGSAGAGAVPVVAGVTSVCAGAGAVAGAGAGAVSVFAGSEAGVA
jgi:hypothetical protein